MPVLIRRYKGNNGVMQEERIDEDDRMSVIRGLREGRMPKSERRREGFIERMNGSSSVNRSRTGSKAQ